MILIPKHEKDRSKLENYRPLTIGSLICRTYWGIIDQKLREVITFSPRQKDFVAVANMPAPTIATLRSFSGPASPLMTSSRTTNGTGQLASNKHLTALKAF
jgi:hypothetical protein